MKDLTMIGELAVVERQSATIEFGAATGHSTSKIDEVLLTNGEIVFQCMSTKYPDCVYTAPKVGSVVAHMTMHGKVVIRQELRTANAELLQRRNDDAAREQRATEIRATKARALENARAAKAAKAAKAANAVITNGEVTTTATSATTRTEHFIKKERRGTPAEVGGGTHTVVGDLNLAKQAQNVITAFNAMQEAADQFQAMLIGYMRAAQTCTEDAAVIDPQILAKAQQYDELRALLGK